MGESENFRQKHAPTTLAQEVGKEIWIIFSPHNFVLTLLIKLLAMKMRGGGLLATIYIHTGSEGEKLTLLSPLRVQGRVGQGSGFLCVSCS